MEEEEKEKKLMQTREVWLLEQKKMRETYFSQNKSKKFDEFLEQAIIITLIVFIVIVILCFVFRKSCKRSLVVE